MVVDFYGCNHVTNVSFAYKKQLHLTTCKLSYINIFSMHKKWLNVFSFFTSNFIVNFMISVLCLIFVDLKTSVICFLSFGFFIALYFREVYPKRKIEYIFYFNNGLTKTELILYCFLLNVATITLIILPIYLWFIF